MHINIATCLKGNCWTAVAESPPTQLFAMNSVIEKIQNPKANQLNPILKVWAHSGGFVQIKIHLFNG